MKETKEQLVKDIEIAFRKQFREIHNERINNENKFKTLTKTINNGNNTSLYMGINK
jgi:hypothetical protein